MPPLPGPEAFDPVSPLSSDDEFDYQEEMDRLSAQLFYAHHCPGLQLDELWAYPPHEQPD